MADRAIVTATDPLTVQLIVAGTTLPGLLLAGTAYQPTMEDVVTCLLLDNSTALVLGMHS
jgi:hypothetical protein